MIIYKQYDQSGLDKQYNNRLHVPEFATYLERWDRLSRQTEKEFHPIQNIQYGELPRERLDIYPSALPQSKTLIYIHGGYWQRLDKSDFQFLAPPFQNLNVTTVLITYPLAPHATIDEIVASCRKAIKWVHSNISSYNGDPEKIYIAGQSAGGHLVAMLMATEWENYGLTNNIIKGAGAFSGLYDLVPVWLSFVNEVVKLDKEMALRNSPVLLNPTVKCPLLLAVGKDESDEFMNQTRELYASWEDKNLPIQLLEIPGLNHYSILETMIEKDAPLCNAFRKIMGI